MYCSNDLLDTLRLRDAGLKVMPLISRWLLRQPSHEAKRVQPCSQSCPACFVLLLKTFPLLRRPRPRCPFCLTVVRHECLRRLSADPPTYKPFFRGHTAACTFPTVIEVIITGSRRIASVGLSFISYTSTKHFSVKVDPEYRQLSATSKRPDTSTQSSLLLILPLTAKVESHECKGIPLTPSPSSHTSPVNKVD